MFVATLGQENYYEDAMVKTLANIHSVKTEHSFGVVTDISSIFTFLLAQAWSPVTLKGTKCTTVFTSNSLIIMQPERNKKTIS